MHYITMSSTSLYTTGQELALMKILRPVRSRWYDPRPTSHPREMLPVGTGWYDSSDAVIPLSRFLSVGEEVEFSCTAMEHRNPFLWIRKVLQVRCNSVYSKLLISGVVFSTSANGSQVLSKSTGTNVEHGKGRLGKTSDWFYSFNCN